MSEECPITQVTCFLCEGTNHVPAQCQLYSVIQQGKQVTKSGMHQIITKESEKAKPMKAMVESQGILLDANIQIQAPRRNGGFPRNYSRKRGLFPTFEVEFTEQEWKDFLASENSKKKKKRDPGLITCFKCKKTGHFVHDCPEEKKGFDHTGKVDIHLVECHICKELGHYSWKCLGRINKPKSSADGSNSQNVFPGKDISQVLCFNCSNKGHYANKCPEKEKGPVYTGKRSVSQVLCFKCKTKGHYANDCPEPGFDDGSHSGKKQNSFRKV